MTDEERADYYALLGLYHTMECRELQAIEKRKRERDAQKTTDGDKQRAVSPVDE